MLCAAAKSDGVYHGSTCVWGASELRVIPHQAPNAPFSGQDQAQPKRRQQPSNHLSMTFCFVSSCFAAVRKSLAVLYGALYSGTITHIPYSLFAVCYTRRIAVLHDDDDDGNENCNCTIGCHLCIFHFSFSRFSISPFLHLSRCKYSERAAVLWVI